MPRTLIITFGAGLDRIRERSPYSPAGLSTAARAIAAAKLSTEHPDSRILVSGKGTEPPFTEAEAMRDVILQCTQFPVKPENIFIENESGDTADNVKRCVAMMRTLPKLAAEKIVIVTGWRNLRRTLQYFRAYGYTVTGYTTRDVLASCIDQFPEFRSVDAHPPSLRERLEDFLLRIFEVVDPRGALVSRIARWHRR